MAIDSGHWFCMIRTGDYVEVKIPDLDFDQVLPVSDLWRVTCAVRTLGRHLPVEFTDQIFSRMNFIRREWAEYRRRLAIQEERMATIGECAVVLSYVGGSFVVGYLFFLWAMS